MPSIMAKSERTSATIVVVHPDGLTGLLRLTQVPDTRRHHVAVSLLNEVPRGMFGVRRLGGQGQQ